LGVWEWTFSQFKEDYGHDNEHNKIYKQSLFLCTSQGGVTIPYSDSIKYLGVTISNTLSWEKQISKTTSRVFAALY